MDLLNKRQGVQVLKIEKSREINIITINIPGNQIYGPAE